MKSKYCTSRACLSLIALTVVAGEPLAAASFYWDGMSSSADADGGAGTWDAGVSLNWDDAPAAGLDMSWPTSGTDNDAVFGGVAGAVSIDATGVAANDLHFTSNGYTIGGGMLTFTNGSNNANQNTITADDGVTASISAPITTPGAITLVGPGTVKLGGDYNGTTKNFFLSNVTAELTSPTFVARKFVVGINTAGTNPSTINVPLGSYSIYGDYFGVADSTDGTLNVTGASINTSPSALFVGNGANTGTINITAGELKINAGPLYLGAGYNGNQSGACTGVLNISGTGSYTHNSSGGVKLTNAAGQTGTVNLLAGGTFSINGSIINQGAGEGSFNFNGGTLRSLSNTPNYFAATVNTVVNSGGAIIDTNGYNATISSSLTAGTGSGGLTKRGAGYLSLAGANYYTGDTLVEEGRLVANIISAIPNYEVPGKVKVSSGAGLGARLGELDVTETEFADLLSNAEFSPNSFVVIDTYLADATCPFDIGTATNLGTAVGLYKQNGNNLFMDPATQTFTGDIVSSGGTLVFDATSDVTVANNIRGNQAFTIQGSANVTLTGDSSVGLFRKTGTGSLNISGGSLVTAPGGNRNLVIGGGVVNQTGGTVTSGLYSVVGQAGETATYNLGGGIFHANGLLTDKRNMIIAEGGSNGTVNINGGTLVADNSTGGTTFGGDRWGILMATSATDSATLNLNGGLLMLTRLTSTEPLASSTFNFNGGTVQAVGSFPNFMQGLTRANVRNGGAIIDTNGFDITINQDLVHSDIPGDDAVDGGLVKNGAGTLVLAGAGSSYNGDTKISEGTLLIHNPFLGDNSNVTIASGATLVLETSSTDTVRTLVIGATPCQPGLWGATGNPGADFTSPSIVGSGLLEVTELGTGTASPFEIWAAANNLAGDDALPTADSDHDGASALLEFALNGDPNSGANPGLMTVRLQDVSAPAGNELTLVAAVRDGATFVSGPGNSQQASADGIIYQVQGSGDLAAFTSAVSHVQVSETAPGLPDLTGTDWEYHTFKLDSSEGLGGKGFLRIKVDKAP